MNVLSLREIDAAWRRQDADAPSDSLKPVRGSLPSLFPISPSAQPTRHVRAKSGPFAARPDEPAQGPPQPAPSGRKEVWAWSAAVALLVALVVVLSVMRFRPAGGEGVVYVEAQSMAAQGGARPPAAERELPAPSAVEAVKTAPVAAAPGARATSRAPKLEASEHRLTERFAQRRAEVSRCFRDQTAPAPEQLALAFEVDPGGAVERAEIVPASLSATPLGTCLLQVARATQFGPQGGYLRFRIPVNARMHKGP
jgi:hypothetical protein